MKLINYMQKYGYKPYSKLNPLYDALGISHLYLGDIAIGKRTPSLELAVMIEHATNGEVRPRDLLPKESLPDGGAMDADDTDLANIQKMINEAQESRREAGV